MHCKACFRGTVFLASNWTENMSLVVVDDLQVPLIIGMPQLLLWGAVLDFARNKIKFNRTRYQMELDLHHSDDKRGIG